MTHRGTYVGRINRVVDHIDAHLGETLDLHALSSIVNFSPWHFHRVFHAFTGETLAERVRRRRLEVAAQRLLATPPPTAALVAMEVGFGSAAVFTRAFRAHFGVTPSAWRRGASVDWRNRRLLELHKIQQASRKQNQPALDGFRQDPHLWPLTSVAPPTGGQMKVEINQFAPTRVAYLRHTGPYGDAAIGQAWQRFARWCDERGLMKPRRRMYGIARDNPDLTPPAQCRYDACVEVDADFHPEGEIGV